MWCLSLLVLFVIFDVGETKKYTPKMAIVEITGEGLTLVDQTCTFKKKYSYNFTVEHNLTLSCAVSGARGNYEIILENEHRIGVKKQNYFRGNSNAVFSLYHTFKVTPESRSISCIGYDLSSKLTRFNSTVYLYYEPGPTTAPSTTNTDTAKPTVALPVELTTGPAEPLTPDSSWKLIVIGAVACVTLFVVIASLAVLCRRKKPQPTDSDYANLTNNSQHEYLTMPVPVPAPRKPVPTVEGTYSEPKDSNDMSEALYADPNVFKAVKSEETYAEPYNAKNELYTTPIPKAQRGNKLKDDPNYSNVFGKDYVNSKRK